MTPHRADVQNGEARYDTMTVELRFAGVQNGLTKTEATNLLGEVIDIHGASSSTSGTYSVETANYVPSAERFVIEVSLCDADDDDYPNVKDDLATMVSNLSVDFGPKDEIEAKIQGDIA